MRPEVQKILDRGFAAAEDFLNSSGQDIVRDMVEAFQPQLWQQLLEQATLVVNGRAVLPAQPDLQATLQAQVTYCWCLGYAVGSSGFVPSTPE